MTEATPLDPAVAEALAQLRGYRLPEPVGWWPPAPGWWLLGIIVLATVAGMAIWLWRRHRRLAPTRAAARELARLRAAHMRQDDAAMLLRGLSTLLRRFALSRWPQEQVAGLEGENWLAFLDRQGGNGRFRNGPGRCLIDAPYRAQADVPADALLDLVGDWLRQQKRART